jgi:ABC-type antimicrobial peptide transport system permease subunit
MIKNYFKIAFRNLYKDRSYSLINIVGLSISLSVSLLMLLWVQDEWSTDKFHEYGDRIYRVKRTIPLEGGVYDVYNGIPFPLLEKAQKELPEVEKFVTLGASFEENLQKDEQVLRATGSFANTGYFEAFSFPIIQGDITQLDKKINAIAISKGLAEKFFGNTWKQTALGQTIHIHDNGDYLVEAIYADFPVNSSIKNEFYYSFQGHLSQNDWMLDIGNSGMQGAILLAKSVDVELVKKKIDEIYKSHQEGDLKEGIIVQKFADAYLFGNYDEQAQVSGGRIEYVRTFGIAALLLLLISCINFVNLATARASKRAKEVGVRKTIGASKGTLVIQFMVEAGMITIISVFVAYLLAEALLPTVATMTEKMLYFDFTQPIFWMGILGIIVVTALLSGAYPAFVLSSFRPINALKNKVKQGTQTISFRKALVVLQFVLALLLIVGAFVVKEQVEYVMNKNLGISKDHILTIHQDEALTEKYDVLKNDLLSKEGITGVTLAGPDPLNMQASTGGVSWPGKNLESHAEFQILWTAGNFPEVFDVQLVAGRYYREDAIMDTSSIVLNERAIEIMQLDDPVGKKITWWGDQREIIGVIKDFHNRPLYEKIEPTGFLLDPENAGQVFVKTAPGKMTEAISSLQSSFAKVLPELPLHFDFVDEQYAKKYKSESLTSRLANYFALISILVSCLGLLGLATFMAEQKTKEIGIRKVLGATTLSIIGLLSKDFIKLVIVALLISVPVSYFFMTSWLQNFAYSIDIQWWFFALSGLIAVMVAVLTVGMQSIRAAVANPIKSLQSE